MSEKRKPPVEQENLNISEPSKEVSSGVEQLNDRKEEVSSAAA